MATEAELSKTAELPVLASGSLALEIGAIAMRDPQAAAHAADGAARASGRPAVVTARGIADVLRVASGLVTASGDRKPVIAVLQLSDTEREVALPAIETASRSTLIVEPGESADRLAERCNESLQLSAPVSLVLNRDSDLASVVKAVAANCAIRESVDSQAEVGGSVDLKPAFEALREAKKPVILLGSGALSTTALESIAALARLWQAPVCLTFSATSMAADTLDRCLALFGADIPLLPAGTVPWTNALTRADHLLALGSGLSEADWFGLSDAKLVRAPVTRVALNPGKDGIADRTVDVDAGVFAKAFAAEIVRGGALTRDNWVERFSEARSKWSGLVDEEAHRAGDSDRLSAPLAAREIVSAAPANAILVGEGGSAGMWLASYAWLRPLIVPSQHASIGASIPMAAGAALAEPDRPIWAVVGDGAFFYCARELAGLAERGVPIAVFVFDDRSWNAIRLVQTLFFRHRTIGTDLPEVDYRSHAELHGCETIRVRTPSDLAQALSLAQEPRNKPLVVDIRVDKGSIPFVGANLILAELDGALGPLAGSAALGGLLAAAKDRPALAATLRVTAGALRK